MSTLENILKIAIVCDSYTIESSVNGKRFFFPKLIIESKFVFEKKVYKFYST